MQLRRLRSVATALVLVVVTFGAVALADLAGADPRIAPRDHDRQAAVLLGTVGDSVAVARPEERRGGPAPGDRDVLAWPVSGRPSLSLLLDAPASGFAARFESRLTLAPRGPPVAAAVHFVNP